MNLSSLSENSSWSKTSLWNIAMAAAGGYNEKNGAKIIDRYYQGEHPYSGSYIFYGYWGARRSSY